MLYFLLTLLALKKLIIYLTVATFSCFFDKLSMVQLSWWLASKKIILECQNRKGNHFLLSSILDGVWLMVCGQWSFLWQFRPFSWQFWALKVIRDCGSDLSRVAPANIHMIKNCNIFWIRILCIYMHVKMSLVSSMQSSLGFRTGLRPYSIWLFLMNGHKGPR